MHVSSGVRVHGAGKSTNLLTEMETCSAERKEKQKRNGTKCHRNPRIFHINHFISLSFVWWSKVEGMASFLLHFSK